MKERGIFHTRADNLDQYGIGIHPIFVRQGLIAMTLGFPQSALMVTFETGTKSKVLQDLLESSTAKSAFHPERMAISLFSQFRYRMENFYEGNRGAENPFSHKSAGQLFQQSYMQPHQADFIHGLLPSHEWLDVKTYSDLHNPHALASATLAIICHYIGRHIVQINPNSSMSFPRFETEFSNLIPVWIKLVKDANIVNTPDTATYEAEYDPDTIKTWQLVSFLLYRY
jgi:hypothetical protein